MPAKSPKATHRQVAPPEMPTPEHIARHDAWRAEYLSAKPGSATRVRNMENCELDRLLFRGYLSPDAHTALSRFQKELRDAGLIFSVRSSVEPSGTSNAGGMIADKAFSRARKISTQQKALASALTRAEHELVVDCLISDLGLNKAGAEIVTRAANILQGVYDSSR